MAWCEQCGENRPIVRQTYDGPCRFCGWGFRLKSTGSLAADALVETLARDKIAIVENHRPHCRGPVTNAFDVCTFCNQPVFASAQTLEDFVQLEENEQAMQVAVINAREADEAQAGSQQSGCGCAILALFTPASAYLGWQLVSRLVTA